VVKREKRTSVFASLLRPAIPPHAVCFFIEGNQWACVRLDFQKLQESSAGFGDTWERAFQDLQNEEVKQR
jgi:hypothetical protein